MATLSEVRVNRYSELTTSQLERRLRDLERHRDDHLKSLKTLQDTITRTESCIEAARDECRRRETPTPLLHLIRNPLLCGLCRKAPRGVRNLYLDLDGLYFCRDCSGSIRALIRDAVARPDGDKLVEKENVDANIS